MQVPEAIAPPNTADFCNLCPASDQSAKVHIYKTAAVIGTVAVNDLNPVNMTLRPPKEPTLRLKNHNSISILTNAESVVASASPPCLRGPIKARLKQRLRRKAINAVF